MANEFTIPLDLPRAACGRCMWYDALDNQGWGRCMIHREDRYYKCMICDEYEEKTDINFEE